MVRHVSFDLWGTLIKSSPHYKEAKARFLLSYLNVINNTLADPPLTEVLEAIRSTGKDADFMAEKMALTLKPAHIIFNLVSRLKKVEPQVDILWAINEIQHGFDNLILEHCPLLICPDTVDILHELQERGITMNVASNTGFTSGKTMSRILGDLNIGKFFNFEIYSEQIGVSKPDQSFFSAVFTGIKKPAGLYGKSNVLHVGDNDLADGLGAISYGFKSLIINSNNVRLPDLLKLLSDEKRDVRTA